MKEGKRERFIYDQEGEVVVHQQVMDLYHEGTSDQIREQRIDQQDFE